ncbi:tetraacyldisaccharide 4'-kinase [Entomobacter blattae]|uniref:Tetraacyldisaccharide 4'-kinase n=1 Tax=Entomobacter blattae TaxID=2762277 RepID=A0A7H1NQH9_9PROT|nr:tetraacyldisaccharide 4'-kinase [Entomobacter blattae]QNT78039.1 Tetraacyldisaccharide 4'-kinase [Entomobacter blattae]
MFPFHHLHPPAFWYNSPSLKPSPPKAFTPGWPKILAPFTLITRILSAHRLKGRNKSPFPIPVLCCGNLTVGGSGKTPVTIALVQELQKAGKNVHILCRGYGGKLKAATRVDLASHGADLVGDEALLLAQYAPCWMGANRLETAWLAQKAGADCLVMDDGFQNTTLTPTMGLLIINSQRGFGNGYLLPAGPLREPVSAGMARAAGVIFIGPPHQELLRHLPPSLEYWQAKRKADPALAKLYNRTVVAFSGIGEPEQFFAMIRTAKPAKVITQSFPDHFPFPEKTIRQLYKLAEKNNAILVTTEKDCMKIPPSFRKNLFILSLSLEWENPEAPTLIIKKFLNSYLP